MFLLKEDLGSAIYGFQIEQITEGNDDLVDQAIATAIEEVRGYLSSNNKKEWLDGRLLYDVEAIFNAEGAARHKLIMTYTATVAKWYLVELCNADIIYDQAKERYDRVIAWLRDLAKGVTNLRTLPLLTAEENTAPQRIPFNYGSRRKFNHE